MASIVCGCAQAQPWMAGRMFEAGSMVLLNGGLYRALRASWNVFPHSVTGNRFWTLIGTLKEHELMKKILGLDQASNITGVCRVRCCKDCVPWYDTELFRTPEREGELLVRYARWLIDELATDFDLVVIERPIVLHASGAIQQEIVGLIRYFCRLQGVRLVILPPRTVKFWATGNGNASKAEMIASALLRFGKVRLAEDEADAAWIADIGYHLANEIAPDTEQRRKILAGVALSAAHRRMRDQDEREAIDKRKADRKAAGEARKARARSRTGAMAATGPVIGTGSLISLTGDIVSPE